MTPAGGGPVRVTHCIGSMSVGGAERQLAELIARLPAERFQQSLVLLQEGGALLGRVAATPCEVVELHYAMRYRRFDPRFYVSMGAALFRFVRHLRRFRPHIVHGWLYWANILAVPAARLAGVPVVLTSRRQLGLHKERGAHLQPIENLCNRFTTLVLANSEAVKQDALSRENLMPSRLRVIHNGVDAERFAGGDRMAARAALGLADGDVAGLVLANMHAYKGHRDVLEVLKALARRRPEFRLLFAGRDQPMGPELRAWIRREGLDNRVAFLGERGDVPALLAACDLLIHPSHQEGFPNAILEAMAAGRPVAAYDLAACREAIIEGVTGYLAPCFDTHALTGAVERLLGDPALRDRMGRAGTERVGAEFSMDRMVNRMAGLYESVSRTAAGERR